MELEKMGRDQKPGAHAQEHRILWQLQASFPRWTPAPVLSQISLQYNARIFSLRRKGWQIANRVEIRDGVKHGAFRLATPGTFPNPRPRLVSGPSELKKQGTEPRQQPQPALPAMESGALFQNLPMWYRDPEEG
jgi:hypothetical protein